MGIMNEAETEAAVSKRNNLMIQGCVDRERCKTRDHDGEAQFIYAAAWNSPIAINQDCRRK